MRLTAFVYRWQLLRYVGMTIGCLIAASSINLFVVPTHLLTGGLAGGILFGAKLAMLTLICMFLNSQVTDSVIAGINQSKAVLIISAKSKEIANAIMQEIGRGVTFLHGEGAFSGVECEVAMVAFVEKSERQRWPTEIFHTELKRVSPHSTRFNRTAVEWGIDNSHPFEVGCQPNIRWTNRFVGDIADCDIQSVCDVAIPVGICVAGVCYIHAVAKA